MFSMSTHVFHAITHIFSCHYTHVFHVLTYMFFMSSHTCFPCHYTHIFHIVFSCFPCHYTHSFLVITHMFFLSLHPCFSCRLMLFISFPHVFHVITHTFFKSLHTWFQVLTSPYTQVSHVDSCHHTHVFHVITHVSFLCLTQLNGIRPSLFILVFLSLLIRWCLLTMQHSRNPFNPETQFSRYPAVQIQIVTFV